MDSEPKIHGFYIVLKLLSRVSPVLFPRGKCDFCHFARAIARRHRGIRSSFLLWWKDGCCGFLQITFFPRNSSMATSYEGRETDSAPKNHGIYIVLKLLSTIFIVWSQRPYGDIHTFVTFSYEGTVSFPGGTSPPNLLSNFQNLKTRAFESFVGKSYERFEKSVIFFL